MAGRSDPVVTDRASRSGIVDRRTALSASALGITSLVLPAATAAASSLLFEPSALTYGASDTAIAGWQPFDSDDPVEYSANGGAGVLAERIDRDHLTAYLTVAGANDPAGDPQVTGLDSTPLSFSDWDMQNGSSGVTLETSPHLRFTISVAAGGGTLTLATLVLHSVRNMAGGSNSPVNLAAYVTAPAEGGGDPVTTLRRTASILSSSVYPTSQSTRHVVINLGLAGRSFAAGDTVTVRVYPYATAEVRQVRLNRYSSDPAPTAHTAQDAKDPDRVNATLETANDWMAAFVGTYTAPTPTP